jgi:hypothetical protein
MEDHMVGKPSFPDDVDVRDDLKGSSAGTPGLTALDEEREASLADEGGTSGAVVESQDVRPAEPDDPPPAPWGDGPTTALVAVASFAAAALGVLAYRRWAH